VVTINLFLFFVYPLSHIEFEIKEDTTLYIFNILLLIFYLFVLGTEKVYYHRNEDYKWK